MKKASKKASKKGSKKASKKASKKGSKKASKKGSKKASKKARVKLVLQGSYKGVKKLTKMKTFDIIDSVVLRKKYVKNKLDISTKDNKIHIYHMFNAQDGYSGRAYGYRKDINIKFNDSKKQLTYKLPEYENNYNAVKNVLIKINFTETGWRKVRRVLSPPDYTKSSLSFIRDER